MSLARRPPCRCPAAVPRLPGRFLRFFFPMNQFVNQLELHRVILRRWPQQQRLLCFHPLPLTPFSHLCPAILFCPRPRRSERPPVTPPHLLIFHPPPASFSVAGSTCLSTLFCTAAQPQMVHVKNKHVPCRSLYTVALFQFFIHNFVNVFCGDTTTNLKANCRFLQPELYFWHKI